MSRSAPLAALLCLVAAPAWGQTAATPAPTRLWAAQTTANQITLVWTGSAGATGYVLYRNAGGGGSQPKVATLAGNVRRYVYIVRSAAQDVQQFHLEATGAGGSSPKVPFNPVTMVSGPVPPVAPASLTATASSPTVVTLTWPAAPGATAYILGRSVGTGGLNRLCDFCSTATTYVDSTATPGVRHVYSVAALTPSGLSTRAMSSPLIELFGNWLTGREALLSRLLQTDPMVALLTNGNAQPMEVGAGGLFIKSNMFGDARDRPIGLKPGQPAKGAGFYAPLPLDPKAGTTSASTYLSKSGAVVSGILAGNPFATMAQAILESAFGGGGFSQALGGAKANITLVSTANAAPVLGGIASGLRSAIGTRLASSQQATGMAQLLTVLTAVAAAGSESLDLYLFEKIVALTPQAIANAMAQTKGAVGSAASIDVAYVDSSTLQGKYVLHLKVEKL